MASRIKGITIELGGDTTKLDKALQGVNQTISYTKYQLKDVERLLKLDPSNTELLAQKQRLLGDAISQTKEKLSKLQEAANAANKALANGEISQEQYDAIQREIVQTEQELKGLEDQLNETGDGFEEMGEKSKKGAEIAKTALKGIAVVATAVAGAVVKVVKDAVESYANYEQLVGGVETLFKTSADEVQKYALDAYKTAGLSANEYMETVTSFSASLIQSLGGDTEKAAEIGNQAIVDMSDNANKMGTDIASIQNAYQGFAKQNYTMLDNLKLGYGGTKEEMQRLLDDASKLSGVKYDISSFSDIANAIHVIQQNLDITGTTEKEAMSTIQGSASMTKSAWDNVLAALGGADVDLQATIQSLITSAQALLTNLIPVIESALGGIVDAIGQLAPIIVATLPGLVGKIIPPLLEAVMSIVSALVDVAPDLIETIATAILDQLPTIINTAVELIITLATGMSDTLPKLIPVILNAIVLIVNTLLNNLPMIISAAFKIVLALAKGIVQNIPTLLKSVKQIVSAIASTLGNLGKTALTWGKDMLQGFINGITSKISNLKGTVSNIAQTIKSFLHFSRPDVGPLRDYEKWMPDFIEGMANGIEKNKYKLTDALQGMSAEMTVSPSYSMNKRLDGISNMLSSGNTIVLDTGELVGATAYKYNNALGNIARLEAY